MICSTLGVGVRDHLPQLRRGLLGDPSEDAVAEPAGKGLLVAEELEHHRAAREDVGAVVDRQAAHLLGRHVVEAADQRAGVGDAGIGQLGDAEVEDLQAAAPLLDHQVGRLDVAVDDVEAVRVGQAVAQLLEQPQLAGDDGRLLAPDPHRQRLAVDVLHGDERLAVLLADVEDADDVLVLEHAGGVRFLHEAAPDLVVVDAFLEQLDGDRAAADLGVAGAQERAHPARPDRADDLVATDGVGNCHGRPELYVRCTARGRAVNRATPPALRRCGVREPAAPRPRDARPQLGDEVQSRVAVVAAQHGDRVAAQPAVEDLGVDAAEIDVPADVAAARGERRVAGEGIEVRARCRRCRRGRRRRWRTSRRPRRGRCPGVPFSPTRRPNSENSSSVVWLSSPWFCMSV